MRRLLVLILLAMTAASPAARGLTLAEPTHDPRGRPLSAANPLYACYLGVGDGGEWIRPSSRSGGACLDVTAKRPLQTPVPVTIWSACIFKGPLGRPVWGPITTRSLVVEEILGPAPWVLP